MEKIVKTIGIIGAGKLGVTLAQLAIKAGYRVLISGSGAPDKIALSIEVLAPGAVAMSSSDATQKADIVILAIPLGKYMSLPKEALANKIVIDAMNYWWEVDGIREDLTNSGTSSSELVQQFLDESTIVKAFNHMGYHDLHDEAKNENQQNRKSIAIAGDDEKAISIVSSIVNSLGFDPVVAGKLADGIRLEPGSEAFGANVESHELQKMIDRFSQNTPHRERSSVQP